MNFTEGDTDTLLADKVSNTCNVSLPGHLDIGTTYTSSRIRCNAELGGYTGCAELKAASSYDMFLNLSPTRTDGGWMYFKTNDDGYIQLPGSDNKVNIYKGTTISSNLTINCNLGSSMKFPLGIKSSTIHTEFWTLAPFHQGIANSGSWLQFSRDGASNIWQTGMPSDSSDVIRAPGATNRVIVHQNGNTTISGNLNVGLGASVTSVKAYVNHAGNQDNVEIEASWGSQGFINFNTDYADGLLLVAVKGDLYVYRGLNLTYFTNQQQMRQMIGLKKTMN